MNAAESNLPGTRADLLLEHVNALEESNRPSANERLERIVGGYLARLLVGALKGGRRSRSVERG
jgi:hypothetical protein